MKKLNIACLFYLLGTGVFAAQVIQVTSNPQVVGVSAAPNQPYNLGEMLCLERDGENIGCGTITRLFKKGAAVELENGVSARVGDRVTGRSPASLEEVPVEAASTGKVSTSKKAMLGKFSVGINYPNYSLQSSSYSKLFSYLLGVGVEVPISPSLSLEPSLFYSPEWVSSVGNSVTSRVTVSYLEVPVYLKWRPFYQTTTNLSPYILVGPSYGYLLSAKQSFEGEDSSESDITQLLNSSRVSLNLALGFDTDVSDTLTLGFSLRYLMAISSPTRNTTTSSSAKILQGLVTLGWDYEDDVFE